MTKEGIDLWRARRRGMKKTERAGSPGIEREVQRMVKCSAASRCCHRKTDKAPGQELTVGREMLIRRIVQLAGSVS
jgi:hypothetical protein